ncbi:MAG TPA: N,N-dimethylformamidase beta subunit family domain-containing protein [Acidimicrobiales bacterium]|jgi:N,N-dimethylformamidase|nr:N,N-dimethylformamidase beta subunit family domain-containing protein [Acidimicrobiales bacterium]
MAERPYLVGYADRLSALPGERVAVMLSAQPPTVVHADVVAMGRGEVSGEVQEEVVVSLGHLDVPFQQTVAGSCVVVPGAERDWSPGPFVAAALIMPTFSGRHQTLLSQTSGQHRWELGLSISGAPRAVASWPGGQAEAVADAALVLGAWYMVAADFVPGGGLDVVARPLPPSPSWWTAPAGNVRPCNGTARGPMGLPGLLKAPVFLAARAEGATHGWTDGFNGKMEAPRLLSGVLDDGLVEHLRTGSIPPERRLVEWDFSVGIGENGVPSIPVSAVGTPQFDGACRNGPLRAVTGHGWDGSEHDFRRASRQYGAVHFHSDDLDDCRWAPTVEFDLPPDLVSGAYALRAQAGDGRIERVPMFVRALVAGNAPLLVLLPTASYLAYANDHPASDGQMAEAVASRTPVLLETDMVLQEHREWGLSCYDTHGDGSGVACSSRLRPLLNMRPTHRYHVGAWQLPADLALLSWLDDRSIPYEVATDEDLDQLGTPVLAPYRAVLTGTHPEYYTTRMLDAVEHWVASGGRLVYLGANGFYWRCAFDPDRPGVLEIRRGQAGSRAWESAPGESHLASTGERGGLWRHLGRAPQKMTGVGYAAQGFDRSGWYRRLPDADDPRAAFILKGVETATFGRRGSIGGGAVGQEIDRYDRQLGTPHDALVLATSEGLTEGYLRCVEEVTFMVPGTNALLDPQVRADMVYLVNPAGGAVFATGSIAWAGALDHDEDIDRVTANVVRRFCDPRPLEW